MSTLNPYIAVVARKQRNLKKKLERISNVEKSFKDGKSLDEEQLVLIGSKQNVEKSLLDLSSLRQTMDEIEEEENKKRTGLDTEVAVMKAPKASPKEKKAPVPEAAKDDNKANSTDHIEKQFMKLLKVLHVCFRYSEVTGKPLLDNVDYFGKTLIGQTSISGFQSTVENSLRSVGLYVNDELADQHEAIRGVTFKQMADLVDQLAEELEISTGDVPANNVTSNITAEQDLGGLMATVSNGDVVNDENEEAEDAEKIEKNEKNDIDSKEKRKRRRNRQAKNDLKEKDEGKKEKAEETPVEPVVSEKEKKVNTKAKKPKKAKENAPTSKSVEPVHQEKIEKKEKTKKNKTEESREKAVETPHDTDSNKKENKVQGKNKSVAKSERDVTKADESEKQSTVGKNKGEKKKPRAEKKNTGTSEGKPKEISNSSKTEKPKSGGDAKQNNKKEEKKTLVNPNVTEAKAADLPKAKPVGTKPVATKPVATKPVQAKKENSDRKGFRGKKRDMDKVKSTVAKHMEQ